LIFFLCMLIAVSCSSLLHLNLVYRLPSGEKSVFHGKKIFLSFLDKRQEREVIGPGVRQVFRDVSGNFSLSLMRGDKEETYLGVYELPELFLEVFGRRLRNEGLSVVERSEDADVELRIVLTRFRIDLVNRKWKMILSYEGVLLREGNVLSRQRITTNGERVKLMGQRQADRLAGDILTDAVNQFDIQGLLGNPERSAPRSVGPQWRVKG